MSMVGQGILMPIMIMIGDAVGDKIQHCSL